jgi:glycosyltransferase involved in cell wall biosynthesis
MNDKTHLNIDWYNRKSSDPGRIEGGQRTRGELALNSSTVKPLVSIITVVYNCVQHIEQALTSVLNQTYDNIEYIVIDGGSTDGTLDIIRRYDSQISYWMSEPDAGISDAFNKGISLSQGEIVGLLNSDDWYPSNHVEKGVHSLQDTNSDFIFGNLLVHDVSGATLYKMLGNPDYARVIHNKMSEICHPTALVKRSVYENIGLFDVHFSYAMDYEWFLRLHRAGGKGCYISDITVHMRVGGASDAFNTNALNEVRKISIQYGEPAFIADILYLCRVLKRSLKHILEKWAPWSLYHLLRKLVNPRYAGRVNR